MVEACGGIIGVVKDDEDVAAWAIAVVEEEVGAYEFFVVIPLYKEFDKKICRKGIQEAIGEGMDV